MSLLQSVIKTQDAASQAKAFLNLMNSLGELEADLRAAGQIQKDVDAATQKRDGLKTEISSLQKTRDSLNGEVGSLQSTLKTQQKQFDADLKSQQATADADLAAKHDAIIKAHETQVAQLTAEIAALHKEVDDLTQQKTTAESQIGALRQNFQKAHAALHG